MNLKLTDLTNISVYPDWDSGGYDLFIHYQKFKTEKEAEEYIKEVKFLPFRITEVWGRSAVNIKSKPRKYRCQLQYYATEENFMKVLNEVLKDLPYITTIEGPIVYPKTNIKDLNLGAFVKLNNFKGEKEVNNDN